MPEDNQSKAVIAVTWAVELNDDGLVSTSDMQAQVLHVEPADAQVNATVNPDNTVTVSWDDK